MRAKFILSTDGGSVTFYREPGDRKYYGLQHASGEHNLFYNIKKWLNQHGFDVIKKRAQSDGHMLGDEYQPYIRVYKRNSFAPHIAIYSGFYALRGANEDWNEGEVTLLVQGAFYEKSDGSAIQPDWRDRIMALAEQYPDIECKIIDSIPVVPKLLPF